MSDWADHAALLEPCFALCVFALKEEDGVGISKVGAKIADRKAATKHGNDLYRILESVDADEVRVVVVMDLRWPLKV